VLKAQSLVLFSCFGLDSFQEWQNIASIQVIPAVVAAQTVGDVLLDLGFVDPVVESEWLSLNYSSQLTMRQEMMTSAILSADSLPATTPLPYLPLQVTIEVIYAHAWCPQFATFKANHHGEVAIPVQQL
jgi:hypothetical protein